MSLAFLLTDLASLSSETKRKHPEIRDAAEKSIQIIKENPTPFPLPVVLKPIYGALTTKNAKVISIGLGSLHRLISLRIVEEGDAQMIVGTMADVLNQGVDIQLRVLQTLLSLITNYRSVNGALLGDALLLCFKLYESKIAVVSSTAAATLRQLVMFVVDKMQHGEQEVDVKLPDGRTMKMSPSARDGYSVFEDLCLLANNEKPGFLKLDFLQKTFALELIESVLTNYHHLFTLHDELILLLRHHLCPLLIKSISERPHFPLTLRCTRVIYLILKQFSASLETEAEVFLVLLFKLVHPDDDFHPPKPEWMRILAMEIIRGLCTDPELLRSFWTRYDETAKSAGGGAKVFENLISTLNHLLTSRQALSYLGTSPQLSNYAPTPSTSLTSISSNILTTITGGGGSGPSLDTQSASMKIQCIDQLDKAEPPAIPDGYIYLLGIKTFVSICEGLVSPLSVLEPDPQNASTISTILQTTHPTLLDTLSRVLPTNVSSELFLDLLTSLQSLVQSTALLSLSKERDECMGVAASFAIPSRVVEVLLNGDGDELKTPRSPSFSENLMAAFSPSSSSTGFPASNSDPTSSLGGGAGTGASPNLGTGGGGIGALSERNVQLLKLYLSLTIFLGLKAPSPGVQKTSWEVWLSVLRDAQLVLTNPPPLSLSSGLGMGMGMRRSISISGNVIEAMQQQAQDVGIQKLFEATQGFGEVEFEAFVEALCSLAPYPSSLAIPPPSASASFSSLNEITAPRPTSITAKREDFAILQLGFVLLLPVNLKRLIQSASSSSNLWTTTTSHILNALRAGSGTTKIVQIQAAKVIDGLLYSIISSLVSDPQEKGEEIDKVRVRKNVLEVLKSQIVGGGEAGQGGDNDIKKMGLECLDKLVSGFGFSFVEPETGGEGEGEDREGEEDGEEGCWRIVFGILGSVCSQPPQSQSQNTDTLETIPEQNTSPPPKSRKPPPLARTASTPSAPSSLSEQRSHALLTKLAFGTLTQICETHISILRVGDLRRCVSTLGLFGKVGAGGSGDNHNNTATNATKGNTKEDGESTNIALMAAASLLWSVSDSIQSRRRTLTNSSSTTGGGGGETESELTKTYLLILSECLSLSTDPRPEVRHGAISTLFRSLGLYGGTFGSDVWENILWQILDGVLCSVVQSTGSGNPGSTTTEGESQIHRGKGWVETKVLTYSSLTNLLGDYLAEKIIPLESFARFWEGFVGKVEGSVLYDERDGEDDRDQKREVAISALQCLEKALRSSSASLPSQRPTVVDVEERSWEAVRKVGGVIGSRTEGFSQASLVALLEVIRAVRWLDGVPKDGNKWGPDGRLPTLLSILKGVLTYPHSRDYRPDVDAMPPVPSTVLEIIEAIDLSIPGGTSLVMRDLAEFTSLPFLGAFDVPSEAKGQAPKMRVTYVALAKRTMPLLVNLFVRFKDDATLYNDDTIERVVSAYAIPIKLKYDCPPASKFGKDPPLWKTATSSFLSIVKEYAQSEKTLDQDISAERTAGIWRQMIDVFRGGILADCSTVETFPLDVQDSEEEFDQSLINSLEEDVIPHLGNHRIPDSLISQLAQVLGQGSRLYDSDHQTTSPSLSNSPSSSSRGSSGEYVKVDIESHHGNTHPGTLLPRERFSYWCLDLLFLVCSNINQDNSRRRLAALSLPALLRRCQTTMVGYVADEALRGSIPFPRAREDELLYVLRKLLDLRLSPGSLWAAFSTDPTQYCITQPAVDTSLEPPLLIADTVKRLPTAHLFHFYPVLVQIASIPRRLPANSIHAKRDMRELDARVLARKCLEAIGPDMGVASE